MLTSVAPLSIVKFSVIAPLIETGMTKTPFRFCSGISVAPLLRCEDSCGSVFARSPPLKGGAACWRDRLVDVGAGAGNVAAEGWETRLIENVLHLIPFRITPSNVFPPSLEVPERPTIMYPGG